MGRRFLGTNVPVCTDDASDRRRSKLALRTVRRALEDGEGVVGTHVLQERFAVATRRLGVDAAVERRKVELFATMDVVQVDVALILSAIDLHRLHGVSFRDAPILQAASRAGCDELLTEDLQDGRALSGVRIVDPFARDP